LPLAPTAESFSHPARHESVPPIPTAPHEPVATATPTVATLPPATPTSPTAPQPTETAPTLPPPTPTPTFGVLADVP
jgi:hypothetical protein